MEDKGKSNNHTPEDAVFSRTLRAGKRTYFFDVKKLYSNDEHFMAITESIKKFNHSNGKFYFEKHKIFLYREDIEGFVENLNEAVAEMQELNKDIPVKEHKKHENKSSESEEKVEEKSTNNSYSDVNFEDLGKDK